MGYIVRIARCCAASCLAVGLLIAGTPHAGAATADITIRSASTTLGTVLVDPAGHTLYSLAGDTPTTSTCTGGCAMAWPPLTVPAGSHAIAATGVPGTFSTFVRPGGGTQVAYNGKPLYEWQGDSKPGDVTGQGIDGFSVVHPAGAPQPKTVIAASLHSGAARTGSFTTSTVTVASGHAITIRFRLGTSFAGRKIAILDARRATAGTWSKFKALTSRTVGGNGYAYVTLNVTGWLELKATYPGDTTHGAGASNVVIARGH